MCYLVSSLPPASNALRVPVIAIYEEVPEGSEAASLLDAAKKAAEQLLLADHTNVRVWKIVDTPVLTRTVKWADTEEA